MRAELYTGRCPLGTYWIAKRVQSRMHRHPVYIPSCEIRELRARAQSAWGWWRTGSGRTLPHVAQRSELLHRIFLDHGWWRVVARTPRADRSRHGLVLLDESLTSGQNIRAGDVVVLVRIVLEVVDLR